MATVTNANGGVTTYNYDESGNQPGIKHANGTSTTTAFDPLNRITTITYADAANVVMGSFAYALDATGRRLQTSEENGRISSYTHDELYRLTGEEIVDPINGNHSASWSYDAVGNRQSDTTNGVTTNYSYDDNDRLQSQGSKSFSYDDNGSTLSESDGGTINTYSYDSRNKLRFASVDTANISMAYDIDGNRVAKVVDGEATSYVVDNNQTYAQVVVEEQVVDTLDYTFGTDLLSLGTSAAEYTYHTDALGSTRIVTDSAGSSADELGYDAWGDVIAGGALAENQYRYTGEQFDGALELYYLRARFLDFSVGRFNQSDVWSGKNENPSSLNKYVYVESDPLGYFDPSGYCKTAQSKGRMVEGVVVDAYKNDHKLDRVVSNKSFRKTLDVPVRALRPDIINVKKRTYAEIKPLSLSGIAAGKTQMAHYRLLTWQINRYSGLRYSRDLWQPRKLFSVCGIKGIYVKNLKGLLFYSDDETIRSFVSQAATLAMIAEANRRSTSPTAGLSGKTQKAISLLNRASGISARYAQAGIRSVLSLVQTTSLRLGF